MSTSDTCGGSAGGGGAGPGGGGGGAGPNVVSSGSGSGVAAKITHVKATTIDGVGGGGGGIAGIGSSIGIGTIMTSSGVPNTSVSGIKVAASGSVTTLGATPIAVNTTQAGTAFRAIGAGGQSTQVRVVMPPGTIMPQSMIKQLEGAAAAAASGRTQITAIPAAAARTVSNTSITVSRPVTQTTYLPRAGVTATHMSGMGIAGGQRLVTPIRTTPTSGTGAATVAGLTAAGSFVRGAAVSSRNGSSPAATVISPATSTTWMAANTTGQVQLIRAISQPRQRLLTQSISGAAGVGTGNATSATIVATTTTLSQGGGSSIVVSGSQQQQQQLQTQAVNQATVQSVSSNQQQPTYVTALATVLPPTARQQQQQQTATVLYSSNPSTSQPPQTQTHQFNSSTTSGQRFAVATPLSAGTAAGGTSSTARQIRPIQLPKSFSATKLNTTSISIRSPNLPQLAPTLGTGGNIAGGAVTASSPRSNTITGTAIGSTTAVIPATNLSTTRIIQLQQPPGSSGQQIIGSTGRLASNVMLQPIIVNASGGGKIGLRPPVTMATKVQPSLTITQLGIGKLPGSTASGSSSIQQNLTASIQSISSSNSSVGGSSNASPSICAVNTSINTSGNLVSASQTQLLTTQNVASSAGGTTVVPLAITTRGGAGGNILTGTITPIKNTNGITVGKVMTHAAQQVVSNSGGSSHSDGQSAATGATTSVFIHNATAPQRQHSGVAVIGSGTSAAVVSSNVGASSSSSSVITAGGPTAGRPSSTGAFLPAGSTFYYESVPASSVQVSTGVLSLTTTTVTSSTLSQQQLVANSVAMTSMPYAASHVSTSTATFTVVPSSGVRTIGQLQMPVSNAGGGGAHIQAVPVRFSTQLASTAADGGAHISVGQPAQLVAGGGSTQQLLMPPQQQQSTAATNSHQQQQHMIIPLQTSIKVASGNSSTFVSNFLRKRDVEGSPARAAKNLAPTFLSMNSNTSIISAGTSAQHGLQTIATAASAFTSNTIPNCSTASQSSSSSAVNIEGLHKKERVPITSSTRSSRAVSPASSEGSTTVSANSSPGIEQQIQDGSMMAGHQRISGDATHFNPISELYSNHQIVHASALQQNTTSSSSRNSSLDQQPHGSSLQQHFIQNGSVNDCSPRKKARRSTNDSQQSTQSQTSLSLPPPSSTGNNVVNLVAAGSNLSTGNGNGLILSGGSSHDFGNVIASSTAINNKALNNQITSSAADFKENTKPIEYILRKPRNCTLLHSYKQNWKAANNHFQRYSDVKPREERRPTVNDLANQANIMGKINGWKIHHLRAQMEDLVEIESSGYDKLASMLKQMEVNEKSHDIERISELLKGNMQRSKIIADGINEAQNQIMKIFEHKSHVSDIITRCASKRNFKKRDKV